MIKLRDFSQPGIYFPIMLGKGQVRSLGLNVTREIKQEVKKNIAFLGRDPFYNVVVPRTHINGALFPTG